MLFCLMRQNRQYLFNMNYLEVFGVLAGVGVDVSKCFRVGSGVLKHGARAESESEKCDFAHLWSQLSSNMHCNLELYEDENDSIVLLWRSPSLQCCQLVYIYTYIYIRIYIYQFFQDTIYTYIYTKFEKFGIISKCLVYNFLILYIQEKLVYIWYIFVRGFSWDFKPVYLVYYKAKTEKPTVVLKPCI